MLFSGTAFKLTRDNNILDLCFDAEGGKVNVFNRAALSEFGEVLSLIEKEADVAGLVLKAEVGPGKKVLRTSQPTPDLWCSQGQD